MFPLFKLRTPYCYYDYFWVEAKLIKETKKALLINFDEQIEWIPKSWIIAKKVPESENPAIKIKISLYN